MLAQTQEPGGPQQDANTFVRQLMESPAPPQIRAYNHASLTPRFSP